MIGSASPPPACCLGWARENLPGVVVGGNNLKLLRKKIRNTHQNWRYSAKNNVAIRMISTFMPISYVNLLIAIPRFVSMGNLMVFYSHSIFILSTYLQAMPYQSCLSNISKNISLWILQSLRTRKCQKLDQKSRSYFSILRYNTQISSINFAKK